MSHYSQCIPPAMPIHSLLQYYSPYFFDYLVVIDFEATCEQACGEDYEHEIIQFPAILVDVARQQIVDEFNYFCKPVKNPNLSEFCTKLTGITQNVVNNAPEFPEVLKAFTKWLRYHGLLESSYTFAIVADGFCDMGKFLYTQCQISNLDYPRFAKNWINIRRTYSDIFKVKWYKLLTSLEYIGEIFTGSIHNGLDDARNITKILMCLLRQGANPIPNEKIVLSQEAQKLNPASFRYALKTVKSLHPDEFYKNYFGRNFGGNRSNIKGRNLSPASDDKENIAIYNEHRKPKPKSRRKSKSANKSIRAAKKAEGEQLQGEKN